MSDNTTETSTADEMSVSHGEDAPRQRGKGRPFTPERAREAARKSANVRRAGAARERMAASPARSSGSQELPEGSVGVVARSRTSM